MHNVRVAPARLPPTVSKVEGFAQLANELASQSEWQSLTQLAAATENLAEVLATDVLHRDERLLALLSKLVHPDDVRMVELEKEGRLGDEHRDKLWVLGNGGQQSLDGHRAPRAPELDRSPNLRHAPDAESLEQQVLAKANRSPCRRSRVLYPGQ